MKPSTLIVMSVGLIITLAGFVLCLFSKATIEKKYPDRDLFSYEGDFYEIIDGDTVRKTDFSDVIHKNVGDTVKEVKQNVKVLSLKLQNIEEIEIVGHQSASEIEMYNMTPGTYACEISSGVITLTNVFDQTMIFNYVSDVITNFNGIRRFFNPDVFKSKAQKVIVNVDDDDVLNRIDLDLTNCKNVIVRNLTCSLDCKIVLNNSSIVFDTCVFKDPEIIMTDNANNNAGDGEDTTPQPTVINHYLSIDLSMKNGSTFRSKTCKFSSVTALINKKAITEKDVEENPEYSSADIGKYISNHQSPCLLDLDLTVFDYLYTYEIHNERDDEYADRADLVTKINGLQQPDTYIQSLGDKEYPITIDATNCEIDIRQ